MTMNPNADAMLNRHRAERADGYIAEAERYEATCDTCGNTYDRIFQIVIDEKSWNFDSIECAAQSIAPRCAHCGCLILGHGIQDHGATFCCAHCARAMGSRTVADRGESG